MKTRTIFLFFLSLLVASCAEDDKNINAYNAFTPKYPQSMVKTDIVGYTSDSTPVHQFLLTNINGFSIAVLDYGGIIREINTPDRNGDFKNIVLGFNEIKDYENRSPYFGGIVGRYGNRIAKGKFTLDGIERQLSVNDGENHLHGGFQGLDKVMWNGVAAQQGENRGVRLEYISPKGADGYPGEVTFRVVYLLNNRNQLEISYLVTTNEPTIINPTQHTYFNLSGDFSKDILDHELYLNAERYLPVNEGLIPTGEMATVEKTPFDFRKSKKIGRDIEDDNEQLTIANGYDHCWVLNKPENANGDLPLAGTLYHEASGRTVSVYTDQPGIQFYSGNFLDGTLPSTTGGTYPFRSGLCLETQHYPDSPNHPEFPSTELRPGRIFRSTTIYDFGIQ